MNLATQAESLISRPKAKGKLSKIAKKAIEPEPFKTNPYEELRRLVREHTNLTRKATAIRAMVSDRTNRTTGEIIKCEIPEDVKVGTCALADVFLQKASSLESIMRRELKKLPIWEHFVSKVFGMQSGGPIAAYLVASVDIHKAVKPSNLVRYCGYAVIDHHIERPTKGEKLHYNAEMRMRLHQWASVLIKNDPREESPYTKVLRNSMRGDKTSSLFDEKANTWFANGKAHKGGQHAIMGKAMRKAITRMLEDLYIVWRAIEGLPAWPTYYEQAMKHAHGGVSLKELAPVVRTFEEAVAIVFGAMEVAAAE